MFLLREPGSTLSAVSQQKTNQKHQITNFYYSFKVLVHNVSDCSSLWEFHNALRDTKKDLCSHLSSLVKKKNVTEELITFSSSFNKIGISSRTQAL